jgi:hypothetical protein
MMIAPLGFAAQRANDQAHRLRRPVIHSDCINARLDHGNSPDVDGRSLDGCDHRESIAIFARIMI